MQDVATQRLCLQEQADREAETTVRPPEVRVARLYQGHDHALITSVGAAGSIHSDGVAANRRLSGTSTSVSKPAPTPLWVTVSRRGSSNRSGVVRPVHPRRAALSTRYDVLTDPDESVSDPDVSAAARPAPRHDGGRSTPRVANSLIKSGHGSENSSVY